MFADFIKYLKGYVRIRVEGHSPERFMNLCNAHHRLLWGLEIYNGFYEMNVGVKDFKHLRPMVKKTRTKITIIGKYGIPFMFYKLRKRKMFFIGMGVCIGFVYTLSLFVWNIHFEGNVTQETEELIEYLETINVKHGTLKKDIECESIETSLRKQYPNMLWVSAEMRGTRILVQVKENTDKDIVSKLNESDETYVSIVAEESGEIESMIVRAGTPIVSMGDKVEIGQVLVEGYYTIKNDAGEIEKYVGTIADADIVLSCLQEYSDCFSLVYKEKVYTGKKKTGITIRCLKKQFSLQPKIKYEKYDDIVTVKEIHVTENFYLPLSIESHKYLEYEEIEKKYTENEIKAKVEQRFLHKYKNILQKGVQIIEKNVKIDTNDTLCIVGGSVKMRVPVTKKVPVIIPEVLKDASVEGEL